MVTWLSVVVLNVDLGLAIGVVFSMMTVICRTQRFVQKKTRDSSVIIFSKEGKESLFP